MVRASGSRSWVAGLADWSTPSKEFYYYHPMDCSLRVFVSILILAIICCRDFSDLLAHKQPEFEGSRRVEATSLHSNIVNSDCWIIKKDRATDMLLCFTKKSERKLE